MVIPADLFKKIQFISWLSRYVIAYDIAVFGHEKLNGGFDMNIMAIRSDRIYRDMINAAPAEKDNIYRNELMKPFESK